VKRESRLMDETMREFEELEECTHQVLCVGVQSECLQELGECAHQVMAARVREALAAASDTP
jgi:hypothetical protein